MKRFILSLVIAFGLCSSAAYATNYTFSTQAFDSMPSDTNGVNGNHYIWGIDATPVPFRQVITSATLTISGLNNYQNSSVDTIFTDLLNTALPVTPVGATTNTSIQDTFAGVADYFQQPGSTAVFDGQTQLAATVSNPATGTQYNPTAHTLTIDFTTSEINALTTDLADGNFGFGFDDHCHWYDSGISFTYSTGIAPLNSTPVPTPEPGTMMLLGVGMAGLAICGKRRMRKEV
jgi:hypothetical protein